MTTKPVHGRGVLLAMVVLFASLAYADAAKAQSLPSDEAIWQHFLEWLPGAPPVDGPNILFDQYKSRLVAGGATAADAERQLAVVRRLHRERSDAWRVMFNNIYASTSPGFSTQPNALLISTIEGRTPGRALDVGMGQGRNAVFLALKGWDVTGFDMSDEGIATARKNAERAGVKLNAVRETNEAYDYGTGQWDLIVFMYEPFPITSSDYIGRLRKSMKPGAIIVIESFGDEASAPNRPATAIDPAQLLAAFRDFRILRFEDADAIPDWGGPAKRRVARMVAEKRE
jgi:SAM-dependent methyltransferase